jgi:hypothetical protein
MGFPRVVHV